MGIETIFLGVALLALITALVIYPRVKQPLYRIDRVTFVDGVVCFYPMKRVMFGRWKVLELEKGIRCYKTDNEARAAMVDYLTNKLHLEISETETIEEYGS